MSRTYHASRLSEAGLLPPDRVVKTAANDLRAPGRAIKRLTPHRDRRNATRAIMKEAL